MRSGHVLLALAAVVLTSCGTHASAPSPAHSALAADVPARPRLVGRVVSPTGAPVPNATVELIRPVDLRDAGPEATVARTDADGQFVFSDVAPGHVALTATAPGFVAAYGGAFDVAESAAAPPKQTLTLGERGVQFTGRVRDEHGPVARVAVSAVELSPRELTTYTTIADDEGRYAITLDSHYPYLVFVAAPPRMRTVEVLDPDHPETDLVLEPAPEPRPSDDAIRSYLNDHAAPIRSDDPSGPDDDLEPVRGMVGAAHVVAVGEATHGSRELFRLRHRLVKALLGRDGGVFGLEAGYAECRALDAYVQGGDGKPDKLLRGLATNYLETEEWRDLLDWMRAHNADPKHAKIHFEGFDIVTFTAVRVVVDAVRQSDPKRATDVEAALAPLATYDADGTFAELPEEVRARTRAAIEGLRGAFSARPDAAVLEHHLDVLEQGVRTFVDPLQRDAAMAKNVDWLVHHYAGSRVVLSMHDSHASRRGFADYQLGRMLARAYGDDYVVIGTGFAHGRLRALGEDSSRGIQVFDTGAPAPDSLDAAMALASAPVFAVDLRRADGPVGAWLDGPMTAWSIGFRFVDAKAATIPLVPKRAFDLLVFAKEVTEARAFAAH